MFLHRMAQVRLGIRYCLKLLGGQQHLILSLQFLLFISQSIGRHHVVFSYNEKSQYLIQDLCANNERVIVVDEKFTPETQNMLDEMKVIVIQASLNDENIFRISGAKKAVSISLF